MADPFGIIGVLGIAAQIAKTLVDLGLDWHDAPPDVKDFLVELQTLKRALSETNTNIILNPEFTSAFEGRHSAVLSQFSKDAPTADTRLMVDNCRSELSDLLADLHKRSRGDRVGWERIKSVFLAKRTREAVSKLQRQCQTLNGLVAIDNTAINEAILKEVREGRKAQEDQEAVAHRDKILSWLTPVSYAAQQHDFSGRRRPGTGEWLLTSEEYRAWRDADEGTHTLFCPGIPGAGKTIMSSLIIEDLITRFTANEAVCVAYVYCDFGRHAEQKADDLLSNLLKQLAQKQKSPPSSLRSLYEKHEKPHTRPSLAELRTALVSVAQLYERAYIVIDALDESLIDERDRVLEALAEVQCGLKVKVLATSRPGVLSQFREHFESCDMKEIRATEEDVGKYVDNQLANVRPHVSKLIRGLEGVIRKKLIEAAGGMFLLATLQLGYLLDKPTKGDIEDALADLPRGLEGLNILYEKTMKRISAQSEGPRELTLKVLSWIVHAKRPLKTVELRHALAIRPGTRKLDVRYLPGVEDMVSGSAGLVIIDEESDIIRLVHFTTQDYFERNREKWFPDAEASLSEACVTYLYFDTFGDGTCSYEAKLRSRYSWNPFFDYAAHHWGDHVRCSATETTILSVVDFLQDNAKVSASAQSLLHRHKYFVFGERQKAGYTGLHLAAYFGNDHYVRFLIDGGASPDSTGVDSNTPLLLAADQGHSSTVEILLARGADLDLKTKDGTTPLIRAAGHGHDSVVALLLDRGANIETPGCRIMKEYSPLQTAIRNGREDTAALLITRGANSNMRGEDGRMPLHIAARWGNVRIVQMLLADKAVDINAPGYKGETPLHEAASHNQASVVSVLLADNATHVNIEDLGFGHTPLRLAVLDNAVESLRVLVQDPRININELDIVDSTPLSDAANAGRYGIVEVLLSRDDLDPNIGRHDGCTPLVRALMKGDLRMAELLLGHRNTNAYGLGLRNYTPLACAAWRGEDHLTALLLARGKEDDCITSMLNHRTDFGETPLDMAAKNRRVGIVRMLMTAHKKTGSEVPSRIVQQLRDWDANPKEEEPVCVRQDFSPNLMVPWCVAQSLEGMEGFLTDAFISCRAGIEAIVSRGYYLRSLEEEFIHPGNWAETVRPGVTLRFGEYPRPGESMADFLRYNEM